MQLQKTTAVILADDHILLRDALANLINSFDEFHVTGQADHGQQVLDMIQQGIPAEMVVLDLNMPKLDGFETARMLARKFPEIKILILTMYDSEIALIRLLQVGVRGFLKKDIHPSDLRRALVSVAEGGYYYSQNATGKLAGFLQKNHSRQLPFDKAMLTEIEIDFLRKASSDLTYKEIAHEMKMSPRAIDGLRDGLFEKLDVKSRVGLAIYAVRNGIVSI